MSAWKHFVAFAEWGYLEQMLFESSEQNTYLYMMMKQMIKTGFRRVVHLCNNKINICQELKYYDRGPFKLDIYFNYFKVKYEIV